MSREELKRKRKRFTYQQHRNDNCFWVSSKSNLWYESWGSTLGLDTYQLTHAFSSSSPQNNCEQEAWKTFFFFFLLSWPVRSFLFQNTVSVHCFRVPPLKTSAWILATGHDGLVSRVHSVSLQEKRREKEKENSRVISSTFNKLQAYSSWRTGSFWKHLHQAEESRLLGILHKSWGPERWDLFSDGSTRACKAKSLQGVKKRLLLEVWPWYQCVWNNIMIHKR